MSFAIVRAFVTFLAIAVWAGEAVGGALPMPNGAGSPAAAVSMSGGSATKSLANGFVIDASPWCEVFQDAGTLRFNVNTVMNLSTTRTVGRSRMEMWASTYVPLRGEPIDGFRIATFPEYSSFPPGARMGNVSGQTTFTPPPSGSYFLILVLSEFDAVNCSTPDHFCVSDSAQCRVGGTSTYQTRVLFGSPSSEYITVISASGRHCYQDYPSSAFAALQQSRPGDFSSRPTGTTCASLGMPFFAGYLSGANLFGRSAVVSVYTPDQATAQFLCQGGGLVNCTAGTASYDYSDMWWNPDESGWGITIAHHSTGIIFSAWFTYDSAGRPMWYTSDCGLSNNQCSGILYETTGPPLGPAFDPSLVTRTAVGSLTLRFTSRSMATMTYSLGGISGTKLISRIPF